MQKELKPDYRFPKLLMFLMTILIIEGELLAMMRYNIFCVPEMIIGIVFFSMGIWLIDQEAKRYYKYLKFHISHMS